MTRWVKFDWPVPFKMQPEEMGELAGFRLKRDGSRWMVATEESYLNQAPRLLEVRAVVDPSQTPRPALSFLDEWSTRQTISDMDDSVVAEVERLTTGGRADLPQFLQAQQLLFLCAPSSELRPMVEQSLLSSLASLRGSRVAFVDFSQRVHARTAFMRSIFTDTHAPEWFDWQEDRGFGAMRGLAGGGFQGRATLIDPLLASVFPWVFGISLFRIGSGVAVVLLGDTAPWKAEVRDDDLSDMLRTSLLVTEPSIRLPVDPHVITEDAVAALEWWVRGVDRLMGVALDPALFGRSGDYDAAAHMGFVASVERAFASTLACLTYDGRDEYTRRLHCFEVLDVLEGLLHTKYDVMLNHRRCSKWLETLRDALPDAVARVVMPRCERAVEALGEVQAGFLPERLRDGRLPVPTMSGGEQLLDLSDAAVRLIRVTRNAGHGSSEFEEPDTIALLASHEGTVGAAVSDMAFFHLLRMVADVRVLERPWAAAVS